MGLLDSLVSRFDPSSHFIEIFFAYVRVWNPGRGVGFEDGLPGPVILVLREETCSMVWAQRLRSSDLPVVRFLKKGGVPGRRKIFAVIGWIHRSENDKNTLRMFLPILLRAVLPLNVFGLDTSPL